MSVPVPREKAVFCEALGITDPEQRRQFLDQACGADTALRKQVERLLALSPSATPHKMVLLDTISLHDPAEMTRENFQTILAKMVCVWRISAYMDN